MRFQSLKQAFLHKKGETHKVSPFYQPINFILILKYRTKIGLSYSSQFLCIPNSPLP